MIHRAGSMSDVFGEASRIRPGLYKMPDEPVGPKVLIPGFQSAIAVRGAFGWFTASWIRHLAPGLATTWLDPKQAPSTLPSRRSYSLRNVPRSRML